MTRAVFLDFASLRPQDLDLSGLHALPLELELHDATAAADTVARLQGATIAITNKVVLDAGVLAACPDLRAIAVTATGTNNVALAEAALRGIRVANVQGYGTTAVAQHAFALIMALANSLPAAARDARNGRWSASPTFCLMDYPVLELPGATLGIIGFGDLGQAVAAFGEGLGMRVLVAEGHEGPLPGRLPLAQVLAESDVVSLHTLLTPATAQLINATRLAQMKPGALLINTARGGLIDEAALLDALRRGHLGGAALDVLAVEPPPADHPLLGADLPNLLITPHCAWASRGARQRLLDTTVANIRAFIAN